MKKVWKNKNDILFDNFIISEDSWYRIIKCAKVNMKSNYYLDALRAITDGEDDQMALRKLVIDVLIPHDPDVLFYAQQISELTGTHGITIDVLENDEHTKTVEMTIVGDDLSFSAIKQIIDNAGGSIHSIDQVSAGKKIIEPSEHRGE